MVLGTVLSVLVSHGAHAAAPYTAIVSINGTNVIATDANGTVVRTGVAGTDGIWADATNIYVTVTSGKAYKWSAQVIGQKRKF